MIVADSFVFEKYHDKLRNTYRSYIVKNVEVDTLNGVIANFQGIKEVISMGGGMAIDTRKYIAEKINSKLYSIPTVLSVDTAFCFKSAMRVNNVVTYMGRIYPEAIYIDFDIIQAAPKHLNVSGAMDLLACITASFDWKLNNMVMQEKVFKQEIYDGAQYLVSLLAENIDNIKAVNDDGIKFIAEAFRWVGENAVYTNHSMWESASEHAMFDNMEYICKKPFLHGQIIGLTVYFMSLFQNNQHERATSMIKRLNLDIKLEVLGITENDFRLCLSTLKEFTEKNSMRYTIINAKPMSNEWIDMAINKYKKDFYNEI